VATIEPSATFFENVGEIKSDASISSEDKEAILDALIEAVRLLEQSGLNMDAPRFHRVFGDAYTYTFHPNYVMTFHRKETANEVILRLNTIQRT
jgi:hypothetical protein